MKHDIDNRLIASTNCKGSATSSQNVMNFGPQTLSIWALIVAHSR